MELLKASHSFDFKVRKISTKIWTKVKPASDRTWSHYSRLQLPAQSHLQLF